MKLRHYALSLMVSVGVLNAAADDAPYTWPMTQTYEHNPLFVGFPSQLYNNPNGFGHLYTADPSAHVWNINGEERLFVYASHDQEPAQGCGRMDKYHVFSTTDMKTWTDHGEIVNSKQVPWQEGETMGFMWAPDAAYKNGKFYFYFPHPSNDDQWNATWKVGVAISDQPASGFVVQDSYVKGLAEGDEAYAMIDPAVFVDDDGSAYIYYGGGGRLIGAKLKDNMMEVDGELVRMHNKENKTLGDFHEAPWVFKRNGIYYLTYSDNHTTNLGGNNLCYATSSSPLGPWTYQGVYMLPHGFDTAHGSVVEYKGKWYQFYHTGNYSNKGNLRSVCFDELTFDNEGRINTVRTWGQPYGGTLPEVSQDKPLRIEAEHYNEGGSHTGFYKRPTSDKFELGNPHTGVMTVDTEDDVEYLASMKAAEWVRYSFKVKDEGRYTFRFHMRRAVIKAAQFRFGIDGYWLQSSAVNVSTKSVLDWCDTEIANIDLAAGEHFLEWRGVAGELDIDYIEIEKSVQRVPGSVEAEDYDDEGYLFQQTSKLGGNTYRRDQGVSLGTREGYIYIGDTTPGDWFNYTFQAEPGIYTVTTYVAAGNGNGKFYIDFDKGQQPSESFGVATSTWQDFQPFAHTGVELTEGEHTMTFHVQNALNIDRFTFEKTSNLTGISELATANNANNRYYSLQGIVTNNPRKGVYIVNGRKVIK